MAGAKGFSAHERWRVFSDLGYVCGICGDPIDPSLEVPHPGAATIDHVIPLARGGTHEHRNFQPAHFLCNSLKRDLLPDEIPVAG